MRIRHIFAGISLLVFVYLTHIWHTVRNSKLNLRKSQIRVAVVGAGTAGNAVVYYLKKRYGNRFHVTLFEERERVGGVVTSAKWGESTDWNQGYVDAGMIVSTRFFYPNFFAFLDAERIPTEKRRMNVKIDVGQKTQKEYRGAKTEEGWRNFIGQLLQFPGNFDEFAAAAKKTKSSAIRWFLDANKLMTYANFEFMTIDMGSSTDHVAGCLAFLNMSGAAHYEAPVGGYYRYSSKAASYADQLHVKTKVTRVKSKGPSGPIRVDFSPTVCDQCEGKLTSQPGPDSAQFDAVVLTAHPGPIKDMLPDFGVPDNSRIAFICIHTHYLGGGDAFYEFTRIEDTNHLVHNLFKDGQNVPYVVNDYPNGRSPPFVTYFHERCNETCRRLYVPQKAVVVEYPHLNWKQDGSHRSAIAETVQKSGAGGVHFAGVWTADGRFAEGAWVTGLRAALEVAGEDWETYPFPSDCARRSFRRYALWYKRTPDLSRIPTDCFREAGEVPSYFSSYEVYDKFLQDMTA